MFLLHKYDRTGILLIEILRGIMSKKQNYTESSGNVFADLEFEKPGEAQEKSELARQITKVIKLKKLTQKQAAEILGIDQPKISALIRGRLKNFSLERLIRFLNMLGKDVGIILDSTKSQATENRLFFQGVTNSDEYQLTDKQFWLFQKLSNYVLEGETYNLGQIYLNGIEILNSSTKHKFVFSAHCFREIIEKFPKIIIKKDRGQSLNSLCKNLISNWDKLTNNNEWKNKDYLGKKVDQSLSNFLLYFEEFRVQCQDIIPTREDRISETINNISSSLQAMSIVKKIAKIWLNLDDYFQQVSHHNKIAIEKDFHIKLEEFEFLFFELLSPKIFEDFQEIDLMIVRIEKSNFLMDKLLSKNLLLKLSKPSSFEYFFNKLTSDVWIEVLTRMHKELLENPFEPIRTIDGIAYPIWPVSQYFSRIVEQNPKLIADLIKKTTPSKNFRVHIDFIDCALKMPIAQAAEIGKLAIGWIRECQYERLPKKCIQLALKLALEGRHRLSLSLLEEVLQPKDSTARLHREVFSKTDLLDFQNILIEDLPNFVEVIGEKVIFSIMKILSKVLHIEEDNKIPSKDLSYIWRPQIKNNFHHVNQHSCKNLLISSVIDCSLKFIKCNPTKAPQVINKFFDSSLGVFFRIGICLANCDEAPMSIIKQIIFEKSYYRQFSTWAEFYALLKNKFKDLSVDERTDVFKIILTNGEDEDADVWQYRALTAIKEYLPDNLQEKYVLLHEKYKKEIVGGVVVSSYSWIGPVSSISDEEFEQKTYRDLVEYLKSWSPLNDPFGPSRDGLSRQLSEKIRKNPTQFLNEFTILKLNLERLHPIFYVGIVRGFIETQTIFKWQNVIKLCSAIVRTFSKLNSDMTGFYESNSGGDSFEWVLIEILRLLQNGLNSSEHQIPFKKRIAVWRLIKGASKFIYHRENEEAQYLAKSNDYYSYSINTVEGQTINTIFHYALWVRNNLHVEQQSLGLGFIPEIEKILISFLNVKTVSQISIQGIYGRWFPWLVLIDKDFAKILAPKIFVSDYPERQEAAWQSYLLKCRAYDSSFELLVHEYRLYLDSLKNNGIIKKTTNNTEISRRYCEHLMQLFYRQKLSLHSSDNLIKDFLCLSRPDLIEHGIQFLGNMMKNTNTNSFLKASLQDTLIEFWNFLFEHKNEAVWQSFQQFGHWFASEKLPIEWSIDTLICVLKKTETIEPEKKVLETIIKFIPIEPKRSLDFAHLYFQKCIRKRLHWFYHSEFHQLLFKLKGHIEGLKDKRELSELIHYMGDAGHVQFRDLLD